MSVGVQFPNAIFIQAANQASKSNCAKLRFTCAFQWIARHQSASLTPMLSLAPRYRPHADYSVYYV